MCKCNDCSDTSLITVPVGGQGIQGLFGGYSGEWIFSSSTSTTPTLTTFRMNNAALSSVTAIHINDSNADSINYSAFVTSFGTSTNFGYIKIFKKDDSTKFWMGKVTAVTDNGPDQTITVTYVMHNGSFVNGSSYVISFVPAGFVAFPKYHYTETTGPFINTNTTTTITALDTTIVESGTYSINVVAEIAALSLTGGSTANVILSIYINGVQKAFSFLSSNTIYNYDLSVPATRLSPYSIEEGMNVLTVQALVATDVVHVKVITQSLQASENVTFSDGKIKLLLNRIA